jgi:DNA-binding NarL/FixJ family response regulator
MRTARSGFLSRHDPNLVARRQALTPRLTEVAQLVAVGLSNKEIGIRLSLAPGTVAKYVQFICWRSRLSERSLIAPWVAAMSAKQQFIV